MKKDMKKVPAVRFKGFMGDWEQRKLGDVLKIHTEKNGDRYSKEDVLAVSDTYGCVNQIKFHGRSFAGDDISNYKVVHNEDIIYTKSPLRAKPYGIIKIFEGENGIISPLYVVNQALDNIDSKFIYYVFDTPEKTNRYLSPLVRKGAKNTMNISNNEWLSGEIIIAPTYNEQHYIAQCVNDIDYLISLHQRKSDNLKKQKSYFLQNLFPAKGEKVPKIRFKGFTGEWELRKIGDYYDFKNGLNKGKEYFGTGTPIVNFTDVFNNRGITSEMLKGKVNLTSAEIQNYEVKKGDIFFTRTSETVEEIGYPSVMLESPQNTVFSGFVLRGRCFADEDPLDNLFKKYVFFTKTFRNEMTCKSSMTTRALTSGKLIKNMEFSFPNDKKEQRKIALLLTSIDNLITLHQQKITQLQAVKKFLLQNLFV